MRSRHMRTRNYNLSMAALIAVPLLFAPRAFTRQVTPGNKVIRLLERGESAFGSFASDRSAEGAARMARNDQLDFVFHDAQRRFDAVAVGRFIDALREHPDPPTMLVRVAPVGDGEDDARTRIRQIVEAGADGVIIPHVLNPEQVRQVVAWIGETSASLWPADPNGNFLLYVMIEDKDAVELASEIIGTSGVSIASVGRGSLSSSLGGDPQALRAAIQTVVEGCERHSVSCSALSNVDDVKQKLEQGFRLIIGDAEVIAIGRRAAGGR